MPSMKMVTVSCIVCGVVENVCAMLGIDGRYRSAATWLSTDIRQMIKKKAKVIFIFTVLGSILIAHTRLRSASSQHPHADAPPIAASLLLIPRLQYLQNYFQDN